MGPILKLTENKNDNNDLTYNVPYGHNFKGTGCHMYNADVIYPNNC